MSEQEQFHDIDYCRKEICTVRHYIGQKTANEHTFKTAFGVLTLMLVHCPESFVETVRAQLAETQTRYTYAMMRPGFFIKDE